MLNEKWRYALVTAPRSPFNIFHSTFNIQHSGTPQRIPNDVQFSHRSPHASRERLKLTAGFTRRFLVSGFQEGRDSPPSRLS
jgi:hypothetical protein